jgi:hypothetical protein
MNLIISSFFRTGCEKAGHYRTTTSTVNDNRIVPADVPTARARDGTGLNFL